MQYIAALISISLGAVAQYFFKTGVTAVSGRSSGIAEAVKFEPRFDLRLH